MDQQRSYLVKEGKFCEVTLRGKEVTIRSRQSYADTNFYKLAHVNKLFIELSNRWCRRQERQNVEASPL